MSEPRTEAGRKLLRFLPSRVFDLNNDMLDTREAIRDIEAEADRGLAVGAGDLDAAAILREIVESVDYESHTGGVAYVSLEAIEKARALASRLAARTET